MPRPRRLAPAGFPLHIVQRGNNKQACFQSAKDYETYLGALEESARACEVDLHAYVLMTNHVHLLATPNSDSAASEMMQQLGRKYVLFFNKVHSRSGTLWEGRYRSSLIDTDHYLLACYRYIELNPVRAGIVPEPSLYRWSSFRSNALGALSNLITPHAEWTSLGRTSEERCLAYRRLFSEKVDDHLIRHGYRTGVPVGTKSWSGALASELGIQIGSGKRGRPRKR